MFGSCNFLWHVLKEPVQKFIHNSPIFCHLQPREIKEQCLERRHVFLYSGLRIESQFDPRKECENSDSETSRYANLQKFGNLMKPLEFCGRSELMRIQLKQSAFCPLAAAKLHVVSSLYFQLKVLPWSSTAILLSLPS